MPINKPSSLLILAHGAGAGKDSDFMVDLSARFAALDIEVHCFNFPYMNKMVETGKRRPPDRMPKLIEAYKREIVAIMKQGRLVNRTLFIGGKSMGGRVATLLAAEYNADNIESENTRLPDKIQEDYKDNIHYLTGNIGDVIVVNTQNIHRGTTIKQGERISLTNYYYDGN